MGKIVTFYTYKGGIGRTMALANVAIRLAQRHGLKVIAMDWDLEAPSLQQFFGVEDSPGVIGYLKDWSELSSDEIFPLDQFQQIYLRDPRISENLADRLKIMTAGGSAGQSEYLQNLRDLDLRQYASSGEDTSFNPFETLRDLLKQSADIILVDSRTGITDIGWICTAQLPDALFMLTAANQQSWEGLKLAAKVAREAHYVAEGEPERSRKTFWLGVSRVPLVGELELTDRWLTENSPALQAVCGDDKESIAQHPEGLRTFLIPHHGRWTVGEKLLFPERAGSEDYLSHAYDRIADALAVWCRREDAARYFFGSEDNFNSWLTNELGKAIRRQDTSYLARLSYIRGCRSFAQRVYPEAFQSLDQAAMLAMARQDRELLYLSLRLMKEITNKSPERQVPPGVSFEPTSLGQLVGPITALMKRTKAGVEIQSKRLGLPKFQQHLEYYLLRTGLPSRDDIRDFAAAQR
jgi:hypothetical protein